MVQALNTVKTIAITAVKSEAFKAGAKAFMRGAGFVIGLDIGCKVTGMTDAISTYVKSIGKKKGLKEEDSEEVVETVNA